MLIPKKLYCKGDYIVKTKESSGYIYTGYLWYNSGYI